MKQVVRYKKWAITSMKYNLINNYYINTEFWINQAIKLDFWWKLRDQNMKEWSSDQGPSSQENKQRIMYMYMYMYMYKKSEEY